MILTVASYKGGVGKTTTAVHLAAVLQAHAPTLLLDGDPTRNATGWSRRGAGSAFRLPFQVAPIDAATMLAGKYTHTVIDTGQLPTDDDLAAAAEFCDLLVVPAVPSPLDTDSLGQTIRALERVRGSRFRVLLTRVEAHAAAEAAELRALLRDLQAPVFEAEIPELKAFEKAAGAGCIVSEHLDRNGGRAWAAYLEAGREVLP